MIIAKNLRKTRKQKGLTQRELADAVGVSASVIGLYEKGERNPRRGVLLRLAETLNVEPEQLYANETYMDETRYPGNQTDYKTQLDSIITLIDSADSQKFLNDYARMNVALVELMRALNANEYQTDDELTRLRRIEIFAQSCCTYFSNLHAMSQDKYFNLKEIAAAGRKEINAFDSLFVKYCAMGRKNQKIILELADALAASSNQEQTTLQDTEDTM